MDTDAALASRAEIRKDRKSNATALPLRADRLSVACVASDWLLRTRMIDFPQLRPHKLPVVISNESDHDIVIPAKCTIAEPEKRGQLCVKEKRKTREKTQSETCEKGKRVGALTQWRSGAKWLNEGELRRLTACLSSGELLRGSASACSTLIHRATCPLLTPPSLSLSEVGNVT
ncbi:unnamed protein product [Gadus morhua 'NCC']